MKIVFLNPSSKLGGAERCLVDMMASLRQAEPSIGLHLIVPENGPLVAETRDCGSEVTILPIPEKILQIGDSKFSSRAKKGSGPICAQHRAPTEGWSGRSGKRGLTPLSAISAPVSGLRYVRRLRKIVKGLRPDVVHSNGIKCHLLSSLGVTGPAKTVWHIHDFLSARPLASRLLRWTSSRAMRAIAVSNSVAEDTRVALPKLPVTTIYNAIDIDQFKPGPGDGASLDQLAGLRPETADVVRVGLLATYARWKGHDLFLEAAARLLRQKLSRRVRFYLIGGPIYDTLGSQFSADELRRLAANLGIEKHVGLIGFQNDPANIYRSLDVIVHASTKPEPFGRTIVEPMACAKPVIVSRAGGAVELFTHEQDALGVTPNEPHALALAIKRLVFDADLRRRLGQRGRQTVVERFSRERLGHQLLETYRSSRHQQSIEKRLPRAA